MIGMKEEKKHNANIIPLAKNHINASEVSHNTCGSCNACHQMTRIHSASGSPIFGDSDNGGEGGNLQKPCATNFFQRNIGNNYMQSITGNRRASGQATLLSGVPKIQKKCSCGGSCTSCSGKEEKLEGIQTKLTIGSANDIYEREADRVAEQVMRMPKVSVFTQQKPVAGASLIKRYKSGDNKTPQSHSSIFINKNAGSPLSASTRSFMEPSFGTDFSNVRLHTGNDIHQLASQINARAFTLGNHIGLNQNETEGDKALMAHELTHVVQQRSRRLARRPSSRKRDSLIGNAIAPLSFRSPIVQRLTDPLSDMSSFQAPVGTSGWRGAIWGCYRTNCTRKHKGWDIHASAGTECKAAVAGTTVHLSEGSSGYGDYVVLTSTADPTKKYYYTHLSAWETAGTVTEGAKIGKTGVTGNASSDRPHLHFTVKESGSKVDPDGKGFTKPLKVIEATGSTAANINFADPEPCSPPCAM